MKFSLMIIHKEVFSDIIIRIYQDHENIEQDISDHLLKHVTAPCGIQFKTIKYFFGLN